MSAAPQVLVVGAGPVGVASALLLAKRGVRTLVVERHAGIYPLPRAVHLDDEIYRVLADLGVADRFAGITMPTLGLRLVDARLRTMAEFRRHQQVGTYGFPQANMFDQPELERILRDALAEQPLVELASSTELLDLSQSAGRVTAVLRDVVSGEERAVEVDAVLGCDGANSRVRELIGSAYEDLGFEERWLVVDVVSERALDTWQGVHQLCDPRRAGTYMQVGPGRYRWEFRLHDDETVDSVVGSGDFERLLAPWLGDIPFDSLQIVKRAEYTFRARIADRWSDRRVFLLGDAAHLTPPFIGQGLCAGLRDASNLTWKLADVVSGRADDALLATYESERREPAKALILKARMVGWAMTGGQDAAAHVRRVALAIACRIPGTTDKVLDSAPPHLADGPAVRRTGRRDKVSGGLLPQPWVEVDGQRVLLDHALGTDYAVVVAGDPDPALVAAAQGAGIPLVQVSVTAPAHVVDRDGVLLDWFRRTGTGAVLVRPDHVVETRAPHRKDGAQGAVLAERIRSRGLSRRPAADRAAS
ncbi:MAG: bifunctional 3-(3-hydroxy-phenyl)propionate/3-hydroxycinnamic acid hydroxylase [Candidatus Nanopelagicales bacterium]